MVFWLNALLVFASWEKIYDKDGMTVERRPRKEDTGIIEVRASTHSKLTPQQIFETVWRYEDYPQFVPYSRSNKILKAEGNLKVVYSELALPIIQDRDFTLEIKVERDGALYQIFSEGADQKWGPPVSDKFVRIRKTWASWTLEPTEDGGTDVTYTVASESGGAVPQWIQNVAQKDAAKNFVLAMLDRTRANLAKK